MARPSAAARLTGHPEGCFYSGLNATADAHAPRRLAGLSDRQRTTFLGEAARRVQHAAKTRDGAYIGRLDRLHASGSRTRQPRWDALSLIIEPMLCRLDVATLVLGWLDDDGAFRLNRQRGLSEDSGVSEVRVSRTLSALEAVGYVRRKQRRLFKDGTRWVTRTLIHIRPRFFLDLGLGHLLERARTKKKVKRADRLLTVAKKRQAEVLDALAKESGRNQVRARVKAAELRKDAAATSVAQISAARERATALLDLLAERPDLTPGEARALLGALNSPA